MSTSNTPQIDSRQIVKGTAVVGSLTLVSRFLGFIREVLIARLFGASSYADTFFVALRIPNLLRSIFAEGALTSAFVPVFAEKLKLSMEEAKNAFCSVASLLLLVTSIVTILGIFYSEQIVSLIAPGFLNTPERFYLCVELTRIMFPYIIFVSFISLANGALNSVRVFGISALAQVIMNFVLIIGAFTAGYFQAEEAARVLAWSVLVGGLVQVLSQLPALKKAGFPIFFVANPFSKSTFQVCNLIVPAIFGATVYQLTIFINTQIASDLEPGSVSWISYADRLVQLPIGVFTIALSSVLLPSLSQSLVSKDEESFSKNLVDALRYTSLIILPIATIFMLYADFFVDLIFERGAFDNYATLQTASVVSAYSLGLFAISCHSLVIRAIQAKKDTVTPTVIGIITLILTLFFSLLLIGKPYGEPQGSLSVTNLQNFVFSFVHTILPVNWANYIESISLGATGLALSSSIAMTISMLISMFVVSLRHPFLSWWPFLKGASQVIISILVSCIVAWYFKFTPVSLVYYLITLFLMLFVQRNKEFLETLNMMKRYFYRRRA